MILLLVILTATSLSAETPLSCAKPWATSADITGVWEVYDYPNDAFISFEISPNADSSSMTMVSGPPHAARGRRLKVEKAEVRRGRLLVRAANQSLGVTVMGCVAAGDGWGIIRRGLLVVAGPSDRAAEGVPVEVVKGPYQRRRGAYRDIAARVVVAPRQEEAPPKFVPYSELPEKERILELPSDALVDPEKLKEISKKYGLEND